MNADDQHGIEVLFAITALLFASGFFIRFRERAPRNWPQTTGEITKSETERFPTGRGGEEVVPVLEYEFHYQGQLFKTSHWRLVNYTEGNCMSANPVIERYLLGSSVTVFVNRRRPKESVLEHNISSLCWVPFGFGIFFLFISLVVYGAINK
ncbi:MAG TPA: DUF3592 domain-containing protein [Candidatus Acidoferrum sp.]|jgi:hypothetical protein|nr:DUF3592 domain-containing protein [Candidatus Acidoferrum sp.]